MPYIYLIYFIYTQYTNKYPYITIYTLYTPRWLTVWVTDWLEYLTTWDAIASKNMATRIIAASGPCADQSDHRILIESVQVIVFHNVVVFPRLIYLWTLFQVSHELCNGKYKFLVYFILTDIFLKCCPFPLKLCPILELF